MVSFGLPGRYIHRGIFLSIVFSVSPWLAQAQQAKPVIVDSKYPLFIDFTFQQWNKDRDNQDTVVLLIRNGQTNKTVKMELVESGPDTGVFTGQFSINWNSEGTFQADIYAPPQKSAKRGDLASIETMIKEGSLPRKPYFLRKEQGVQKLSVYNSAEQALEAYRQFRQAVQGANRPTPKPVVDNEAMLAARRAELAAEQARLAQLAREQELKRQRDEEAALQKQRELKKQQEALATAERQKRIDRAKVLSQEALALYREKKFPEAEQKFKESIELNPSETSYYFQYGATLYKNQKYNDALVAFKLVDEEKVNKREKAFYQGVCLMKLKEFDTAVENFDLVTVESDDSLTPSASFFKGVIYFSQEKYKDARKAFEQTLDTSKDPSLDEQADNYIEQIANIEQFLAKLEKRFTATVNTGIMYDSNILLVSNSSSGTATDKEGFRGLLTAGLEYRMIYTESNELNAEVSYVDMYSVDPSLKANANLQLADPMVITAKIPYKWKGKLFQKPYILSIAPGYETLNLNVDGVGGRELLLATSLISTEQTFIIKDNYFTIIKLDWRSETAKVSSSGTSDAVKISLGNNNIYFLDAKKTQGILANWGYQQNAAKVDDNSYNKIELAGGYLSPIFQKSTWTNMLSLSQSDYSKSSTGRKDTNMNFNTSLTSPLREGLQGIMALGFETNTSNLKASTYNKYSVTAMINWAVDF